MRMFGRFAVWAVARVLVSATQVRARAAAKRRLRMMWFSNCLLPSPLAGEGRRISPRSLRFGQRAAPARWQLASQGRHGLRVVGDRGEIAALLRVILMVVQFDPGLAVIP